MFKLPNSSYFSSYSYLSYFLGRSPAQHCGVILGRKREREKATFGMSLMGGHGWRACIPARSLEGGGAEWCQLDGRDETKL